MFCRLMLLTFLLAHHSWADVSELVQSGNGFLYDAPLNSNLPLAPLDLANDEQTQKAFGDSAALASLSSIEVDVVPSVATAASLRTHFTSQAPKRHASISSTHSHSHTSASSSLSSRVKFVIPAAISKKSGYNYMAPLKPFFIA